VGQGVTQVIIEVKVKEENTFAGIRRKKIYGYVERQKKRTDSEKENDVQDIDELQKEWFEKRMNGNTRR